MSYTTLYRKFRPATFDEVKGQDHIVTTLRNQLLGDRIGHAYLFCGTRGTGKTSVAKILARAVNCEHPTESGPCNECETCRAILDGASTNVIEIDAASNNGVDDVRELREEVVYRPTTGRYKVYIIDEAHMITPQAFNALLKTLEEPPTHIIFILATTEAARIPVTILSRCQRYDFRRITADEIAARLTDLLGREGITAEERAVRYIARAADGSMRDALSLLERCISYHLGQEITYERVLEVLGTSDSAVFSELLRSAAAGDAADSLRRLDAIAQGGKDMGQFVSDFIWYMRNLLLLSSAGGAEDIVDVSAEDLARLREETELIDRNTLMRGIRIFSELSGRLRTAAQRRVLTETALIRFCQPETGTDSEDVLARIRMLEQKIEEGIPVREVPARRAAPAEPEEAPAPAWPEEPEKPPMAAPEDLQRVSEQWRKIVREVSGSAGNILRAITPKYDAASGDSILYLETGESFHRQILERNDVKEEIRGLIRARVGREVELRVVGPDPEGARLAELSLDKALAQAVTIPVEDYDSLPEEPIRAASPDGDAAWTEPAEAAEAHAAETDEPAEAAEPCAAETDEPAEAADSRAAEAEDAEAAAPTESATRTAPAAPGGAGMPSPEEYAGAALRAEKRDDKTGFWNSNDLTDGEDDEEESDDGYGFEEDDD